MPTTYPDDLAEWAKQRDAKKRRQDRHAVAFLAVKSDVQAALDAGYAMKTIWAHMQETGRLRCRYETFTKHVKRYIQAQAVPVAPPTVKVAEPAKPKPTSKAAHRSEPQAAPPTGIPRFEFNPTPNKDLLF